MNARLAAASALIRGPLATRWLELVDGKVSFSLATLIDDAPAVAALTEGRMPRSPAGYRRAMAGKHARLVDLLIERKGKEAGVREARASLRAAGIEMGEQLRAQLRLSNGEEDLIGAARLMYRLLGIEFEIGQDGERTMLLVRRCSLSDGYSPLTCEVISAMDEGVVEGLRPGAGMRFIRRNTDRAHKCEAELVLEGRE